MRRLLLGAVAIGMGMAAFANGAQAYVINMATGNTSRGFDSTPTDFNAATNATYAYTQFTYTGPLSFNVGQPQNSTNSGDLNSVFFSNGTISTYLPGGTTTLPSKVDFSTVSSFLASSGSASNFQYGSLLAIDLGVLQAGTVLTIDHDDGASLFQNGNRLSGLTGGPTSEVIDTVRIATTADTLLLYSRQNGAPSILNVSVPEPASMALLGAGLVGVGFMRRRKGSAAA